MAGWSPFGWAWAMPADVARGQWLYAGMHLLLAAALVVVLWRAWEYFLAARLISPVEAAGEGRQGPRLQLGGAAVPGDPGRRGGRPVPCATGAATRAIWPASPAS